MNWKEMEEGALEWDFSQIKEGKRGRRASHYNLTLRRALKYNYKTIKYKPISVYNFDPYEAMIC